MERGREGERERGREAINVVFYVIMLDMHEFMFNKYCCNH